MSPKRPSKSSPRNQIEQRIWLSGLIAALILFGAVVLHLWLKPKPVPVTRQARDIVVSTPQYFTDVYATIRSVDSETVVVETTVTDPDGTRHPRQYTIRVAEATVITQLTSDPNAPTHSLSWTDLHVDDQVQVFNTQNLAEAETITATRIIRSYAAPQPST